MYDFMIIDDDLSIREHLKSMIEWHHLPLNLVCEAGDSDTARELYDIYHPKIIMTDIHIPIISGLELAQEISKRDPETRFIVITGYNDFEYVKDSVTLGAVDLLSKPLLPDAVNASLSKAIAYFDHLRSESASSQAMKQLLEDNLPMLREKFIAHLLKHQTAIAHDDMIDKCHMLGIDIMGDHYAVVIISLDLGIPAPKNAEALLAATRNTAEEIISANSFKFFSFYDDYYRLNLLISWNYENGDEEIEACMNKVNEKMFFLFQKHISAGIGQQVNTLSELSISADQALSALGYQDVLDTGTIINFKNVARLDTPGQSAREQIIDQLIQQFRLNHYSDIEKIIESQISQMKKRPNSLVLIRAFAFECLSAVIPSCYSLGFNSELIVEYSDVFTRMIAADDAEAIKNLILDLFRKLLLAIFNKRSDNKNRMVSMAKEYIDQHLQDENLNLEKVSRHIGLSSIYFCKLFHKEEGISFNDYLNIQRINRAKHLLVQTAKKVFEISYEVGYGNPKYFNYVFKRITGTTPLEYKNAL